MKKTIFAITSIALFVFAGSFQAFADESNCKCSKMHMGASRGSDACPEQRSLYHGCEMNLEDLNLSAETRAFFEDKHFALHVKGIRAMGEIKIGKLELARLLSRRDFDMKAAKKLLDEIAARKSEMGVTHLEFVHELAGKLNDMQWEKLYRKMMEMHMRQGGKMSGMSDLPGASELHVMEADRAVEDADVHAIGLSVIQEDLKVKAKDRPSDFGQER